MVDNFLAAGFVVFALQTLELAGAILLLLLIGGWYVLKRLPHMLKLYGGFLSWAFGTKEARQRRRGVYVCCGAVIILFVADILDTTTPGFPRSGNVMSVLAFLFFAPTVCLDHYNYFWKHSSEPA